MAASVQSNGVTSVAKTLAHFDDEKLTRWNEQLGAHGKTVEDAVEFMLDHLDKEQRQRESEHVSSLLPYLAAVREGSTGQLASGYWSGVGLACQPGRRRVRPLLQQVWSAKRSMLVEKRR